MSAQKVDPSSEKKLKILMVAPVWERVPPVKYGGIELVVSLLTEELVRRGHHVTLYASGDSITRAKLKYVYSRTLRENMRASEPALLHSAISFMEADKYDVVHNHCGHFGVVLAPFIKTPVLTTMHGIFTSINKQFYSSLRHYTYYNSISNAQRDGLKRLKYIATVYNAIDTSTYEVGLKKKDYYFYISRMSPLKGPHVAVRIAKKAGIKLVLAGKIDKGADTKYFERKVKPYIDGKQIKFLGEVTEERKRKLLREAKAFLFTLQWPEPFGLVMIEAMAAGTPVLSFPFGSVPEVVKNGVSGFIVNNEKEMLEAIKNVDCLDPATCRKYVEDRFSVKKMTDDYVAVYRKMIEKGLPFKSIKAAKLSGDDQ